MGNVVYKSRLLEPTIKHVMKEMSRSCWAAQNMVRRGKYIRS